MTSHMSFKQVGIVVAVFAVIMTVALGSVFVDRQMNYSTVTAEVMSAQDLCLLRRSSTRGRSSREYGPMRCEEANQRRQSGRYPNYSVQEFQLVRVSYRSPADDRDHEAEVRAALGTYPNARAGDAIDIRAHTSEPASILSI